ncbi:hypothetical protein EJB05_48568, partial [Eragrostis curvula]
MGATTLPVAPLSLARLPGNITFTELGARMTNPRDKYGCRIRVQYPRVSSVDGPVPPALPVPNCECGHPAVVQQSRHRVTAARVFYECRSDECFFFEWIDGQEMYDPRILLFPWNRKSFEYKAFKRWVPPPPNPPPMTNDEKVAAARLQVRNPPLCHCEYWSELETPPVGLDYTPFFRCALVGSVSETGWRLCDFQEYVYGRKSHWPVNEELKDLLQQYINGKEPLPCDKYPVPTRSMIGLPIVSPPPLCDFQQWIDTERSEEALEYISSWKRGKARDKELAARHKAEREKREEEERRREKECKKAKEKRDKERERRKERIRRAKEAVEAGGPDVLRKGKWPRCT